MMNSEQATLAHGNVGMGEQRGLTPEQIKKEEARIASEFRAYLVNEYAKNMETHAEKLLWEATVDILGSTSTLNFYSMEIAYSKLSKYTYQIKF